MRSYMWIAVPMLALAGVGGFLLAKDRAQEGVVPPPEPEPRDAVEASRRQPIFPVQRPAEVRPVDGADSRAFELNGQALAALDAENHARAVELLEECHRLEPAHPVITANLAEALSRWSMEEFDRGTLDARKTSLAHLERACQLAPDRADLRQRFEQTERLLKDDEGLWTESSEHFELAYDGERRDLLWSSFQITQVLEAAYQDFGERFGHYPVEEGRARVRVVLYRRAGFHDATGMGHWAGGSYDGMIRVPVEDLGREKVELERVLRHEVVHAFVGYVGGKLTPGWLNEGLAQWLSDSTLAGQTRDIQRARAKLKSAAPLPLGELQESLASRGDPERIAVAYAQALAFVDHIERTYGERELFAMVSATRSSKTGAAVFRERTGVDLEVAMADLCASL